MPWAVTADVERFDEALEWFGSRVVITGDQARTLDDWAKREAFWVGGGLQLEQIQRVFDKIDKAIESGESFEEWRKRVLSELANNAHAETVFRNATQRAYNAGRWAQMNEDSVRSFRPYGLVDAILDGSTTEYCRSVNGTLLPLDHPWWETHFFPAHHRCRTSIRNLRRAEAERRGITETPPDDSPAPGFGQIPKAGTPPWKPDPNRHDTSLIQSLEQKAKASGGTLVRPPAEKKRYRPDVWEKGYRGKYGDAAPAVAAGRAALERGLDLEVREVRELLRTASDAPGVRDMMDALGGLSDSATLRSEGGQLDPMRKGAAALAGHLRELPKRQKPLRRPGLQAHEDGRSVMGFYSAVTSPELEHPIKADIRRIKGRAYAKGGAIIRYRDAPSLAHEWGHTLEALNPTLLQRAAAFLRARTKGEPLRRIRDLKPGHGYKPHEVTKPDQFIESYIGKWYETAGGHLRATELTSMAGELLFAGFTHWGRLSGLIRKDPELFLFLLGQYRGP